MKYSATVYYKDSEFIDVEADSEEEARTKIMHEANSRNRDRLYPLSFVGITEIAEADE